MTVCVDRLPGELPNIMVVNLKENCILSKLGVNEQVCSTAS